MGLIFYEVWNDNCDLDLELSIPVFSRNTQDDAPPNQVSSQKDQQLLRYSRNGHILIKYEPSHSNSDSDLDESNSGYNTFFFTSVPKMNELFYSQAYWNKSRCSAFNLSLSLFFF